MFVSNGDTLYRKHVIGAGQSGATRYSFTFEAADSDGSDARDLLLSAVTGKPTGMALAGPVGKLVLDDSGAGTTPLALVDPSAVLGMAVVNFDLGRRIGRMPARSAARRKRASQVSGMALPG